MFEFVFLRLYYRDNIDTDIYGANLYNNYLKAVKGSDISKYGNSFSLTF